MMKRFEHLDYLKPAERATLGEIEQQIKWLNERVTRWEAMRATIINAGKQRARLARIAAETREQA